MLRGGKRERRTGKESNMQKSLQNQKIEQEFFAEEKIYIFSIGIKLRLHIGKLCKDTIWRTAGCMSV